MLETNVAATAMANVCPRLLRIVCQSLTLGGTRSSKMNSQKFFILNRNSSGL